MSTAAPSPSNSSPTDTPLPAPEHLPDDPVILKQMILELLATLHRERYDKEALRHRLDLLLRRLYGPRGERFDPNQPLLFAELAQDQQTTPASQDVANADSADAKRRCRPHGRRQLPQNLPREVRHHELLPAERVCVSCGTERIDIDVDPSEQLEYRPASLFVIEHHVHKYACPRCAKQALIAAAANPKAEDASATTSVAKTKTEETLARTDSTEVSSNSNLGGEASATSSPPTSLSGVVISAPKPPPPIAKGMPGPGLLAHLIVSKYVDHLPLYRLERVYERQGLVLPRSTTCDWLAACAQLLQRLYRLMISIVLQSRVLHTDDTPVKIHDPPADATPTGRLWAYLGDPAHPYNVFDFTPNRKRDGPQRFLATFQGYLQADAFTGYDGLYLPDPIDDVRRIHEVACNAHARRKFYEARGSDGARSHQALAYYRELYEIERRAKELPADAEMLLRMRQDLAKPILNQFEQWLKDQKDQVLPKSPMYEAIGYALNNWTALIRYTDHAFLAIDNNVAEREMKQVAIGRKNWLFVGTVNGGHTAAVLCSFTSTCRRLGVEPWAYLQDVLGRLPTTPDAQLERLLPDRWQATRNSAAT